MTENGVAAAIEQVLGRERRGGNVLKIHCHHIRRALG